MDGWMSEKKDILLLIEDISQLGRHENRWVHTLMLNCQETSQGKGGGRDTETK